MNIWYIIVGVLVLIVLLLISLYNALIRLKNRVDESWSDIDVQLKRRYDLIPNLVNTVKGYASHEQDTLEKVITARNSALSAQDSGNREALAQAETALAGTLKSIFALAESYPELKANQNFLELQRELADTENKIQSARRFYNTNVRDFNTKRQTFPNNIISKKLKFNDYKYFAVETEAEKQVVEVKF